MPGLGKKQNEYQRVLGDLYDKTPKAVLAAIAVSALAMRHGEDTATNPEMARRRLSDEWKTLHDCGIVPQVPPR